MNPFFIIFSLLFFAFSLQAAEPVEEADILAIIEFQDLELALEELESGDHPEDTQRKPTSKARLFGVLKLR